MAPSSAGIGVPIMLAYVYGVVPISLCRSGGCGVSAGNGKGVRIEFDDENDINVGGTNAAVGKKTFYFLDFVIYLHLIASGTQSTYLQKRCCTVRAVSALC